MATLDQRLRSLELIGDDVHIIIGDGKAKPSVILVNGKPSPNYRLPDSCEFEITNPRPPIGDATATLAP